MSDKVKNVVFQGRKEWRRWLKVNHDRKNEIWLVLPKKSAGGDSYRVYYNQALGKLFVSAGSTVESSL